MSSFQKAVTRRFVQAYYVLLSDGRIKPRTQGKIAKRIKWRQPVLSKVLNGKDKRYIPYEAAINFCVAYDISLYWMLLGEGKMDIDK